MLMFMTLIIVLYIGYGTRKMEISTHQYVVLCLHQNSRNYSLYICY